MRILRTLLAGLALLLQRIRRGGGFSHQADKLVVPFPAGGPSDIIARVIGQRMSELIETAGADRQSRRPGRRARHRCGGESKPDGYTIAISSAGALAISPSTKPSPTTR